MRKTYTYSMLAAGFLSLMSVLTKPATANNTSALFQTAPRAAVQLAGQETAWVTIVDEDFSGLTKGSETVPDTESLLDQDGWVTEENLSKLKPYNCGDDTEYARTWGGHNLFEAGGCIAAVNGGFLNTPTGDYSGDLKFSCRMKLVPGQSLDGATPSVDLILLRRSILVDYKRINCQLTEEWQTFTFEADNGWPRDCMVQFFVPGEEISFLIDDIKIEHIPGTVETPKAAQPIDLKDDGFTACWNPVPGADEYLLSVFRKVENQEAIEQEESFESLNPDPSDNTWIDLGNPGYPEGWNINVSTFQDMSADRMPREIYNAANENDKRFVADGNLSVCLDAEGDCLETPLLKYPLKGFKCLLAADCSYVDPAQTCGTKAYIDVCMDGTWIEWKFMTMETLRNSGYEWAEADFSQELAQLGNIDQLRFRIVRDSENMDYSRLAIDKIELYAPGTPLNEYTITDRAVPAEDSSDEETGEIRSVVTGLDPDIDYFYTVKAKRGESTSAPSEEMEVFDVSNPTALPATDVTATGYTANWECHSKVDYFTISQVMTFVAQEDMPDYVVLDEDFGKVVSGGTAESPEEGQYNSTYMPIDQYTKVPGWAATSYCLGNGMIGGMPAPQGGDPAILPGIIRTPVMDLSHGTGMFKVKMRVYAEEGDLVNVLGVNTSLTIYSCIFNETGWQEVEFELPSSNSKEQLFIYSNNYTWFMIDSFKVTHSLSKGDKMTVSTGSQTIMDKNARSAKMENAYFEPGKTTGYYIEAFRLYHGMENDVWQSPESDLIEIPNAGAVESAEGNDSAITITAKDGAVEVTLPENTDIEVFAADGRLVSKAAGICGTNVINVEKGLYIVRADGKKEKVIVR